MIRKDDRVQVVGVVSAVISCASPRLSGLYITWRKVNATMAKVLNPFTPKNILQSASA